MFIRHLEPTAAGMTSWGHCGRGWIYSMQPKNRVTQWNQHKCVLNSKVQFYKLCNKVSGYSWTLHNPAALRKTWQGHRWSEACFISSVLPDSYMCVCVWQTHYFHCCQWYHCSTKYVKFHVSNRGREEAKTLLKFPTDFWNLKESRTRKK